MRKLLILFVIVPTIAFGQITLEEGLKNEIIIEGNVSDVNGLPLTGAGILIKGKSNVIKTDFDGNFNLKAEKGTVLVIGFSGFKTKEFTVGNQIKINIINVANNLSLLYLIHNVCIYFQLILLLHDTVHICNHSFL